MSGATTASSLHSGLRLSSSSRRPSSSPGSSPCTGPLSCAAKPSAPPSPSPFSGPPSNICWNSARRTALGATSHIARWIACPLSRSPPSPASGPLAFSSFSFRQPSPRSLPRSPANAHWPSPPLPSTQPSSDSACTACIPIPPRRVSPSPSLLATFRGRCIPGDPLPSLLSALMRTTSPRSLPREPRSSSSPRKSVASRVPVSPRLTPSSNRQRVTIT